MWCRGEEFREEGGGLFCHLLYFQRKGRFRSTYLQGILSFLNLRLKVLSSPVHGAVDGYFISCK